MFLVHPVKVELENDVYQGSTCGHEANESRTPKGSVGILEKSIFYEEGNALRKNDATCGVR